MVKKTKKTKKVMSTPASYRGLKGLAKAGPFVFNRIVVRAPNSLMARARIPHCGQGSPSARRAFG